MSKNRPVEIEIPLFEFFNSLRQYDRQSLGRQGLGPEEFILLLEQLVQGYGCLNESDLYALCKILWFKPYHTEKVFNHLFNKYLTDAVQRIVESRAEKTREDQTQPINKDQDRAQDEEEEKKQEADEQDKEEKVGEDGDQNEEEPIEEKADDQLEGMTQKTTFQNVFLDYREAEGLPHAAGDSAERSEALQNRIYRKRYKLRGIYFPLRSRQMQQSFQLVREISREGRKNMIDWEGTIDKVAREGFFEDLVMTASPEVRSNLYIFIDHEGSMIAFDQLTRIMVEALKRYTGKQTQAFYFRNCPVELIYENEAHTRALRIEQFYNSSPRPVIIVSDGGAARGNFDRGRLDQTKEFLDQMRKHRIVWLNPIPKDRWIGTTADYIHAMVPMYELNQTGFVNAIKSLKLKHRKV